MKDESVLKNLVQQEAKKKESVRNAETKITKLTEQLQATEKILSVNRMFLKKLQEQVISFIWGGGVEGYWGLNSGPHACLAGILTA
jgi:hypothetical protein